MTSGTWSDSIPGIGTFFVGIDVAPGRYRCDEGKGGWWVRFTGPGGGDPVGSWPLPAGPTEIEIAPGDFAFETHVSTYWRRVAPARARGGGGGPPAEPRPVADPGLRAELDTIVARRRPLVWLAPLSVLGAGLLGTPLLGTLWLLGLGMLAVLVALGTPSVSLDLRRARELERRRDRYLTPEDLDARGRALLARVQAAVDAVRDSAVNREGLLDAVDNAVTLPREEWEIAQVLARQARLRLDHDESAAEPPEVAAALRPLRERLETSVAAVTRRVEALERYAASARAADEALAAHRRLEALAAKAHEYDELVADTVRGDLAMPAIERLAAEGETLVRTLRERLAEAAEAAGGVLPAEADGALGPEAGGDLPAGADGALRSEVGGVPPGEPGGAPPSEGG